MFFLFDTIGRDKVWDSTFMSSDRPDFWNENYSTHFCFKIEPMRNYFLWDTFGVDPLYTYDQSINPLRTNSWNIYSSLLIFKL